MAEVQPDILAVSVDLFEKRLRKEVSCPLACRTFRDPVFFQDIFLVVVDESTAVGYSRGNHEGCRTGFGQTKRIKLDEFHVLKHGPGL